VLLEDMANYPKHALARLVAARDAESGARLTPHHLAPRRRPEDGARTALSGSPG
jgi:hypothetical protein